ncbi:hypothetical protein IM697_07295 [Streptomyces ferrugineus]|uniref:Uncharacterized protein n=1 Tax=Streptomyces ferrugineus TaxID=1413221 RepID=A0A7M2SRU1_9ACTN|nr:hypothetical protein [Streptomyces ferrugineus]QOV38188.1 hypothetical protein IM697_07295 [Streptomyces ferrugineus]
MGDTTSERILSACDAMTQLALHPLALDIDASGARITAVMEEYALRRRSRGPYTPDNLPPETVQMIERAATRLLMRAERPDFTIEGGGRWPALLMTLPDCRVQVRYVVPEDAPPVYQPDPGNVTLGGDIRIALKYLAESLRLAAARFRGEPPVTVALSYPEDPDYEKNIAGLAAEFRDVIPPVLAALEVDRSRCSRKERAAHDDALRALAHDGRRVEPLGRAGFTTRIGTARLQDSGT